MVFKMSCDILRCGARVFFLLFSVLAIRFCILVLMNYSLYLSDIEFSHVPDMFAAKRREWGNEIVFNSQKEVDDLVDDGGFVKCSTNRTTMVTQFIIDVNLYRKPMLIIVKA